MGAGSSALILVTLVISGYLFNLIFYPLRYFSTRAEGQKLFFMAAGAGLILGAFVFVVTGLIRENAGLADSSIFAIAAAIDRTIPVPYACRLLLTIVFAVVGAFLLNGLLWLRYGRKGRPTAKRVYNKLTGMFGNPLSQLLRRGAEQQKLVLLTLKSRKIYCGRIWELPTDIEDEDACVELLPSFSTYRDKNTLRMGLEKTDYPVIALWEATQYLYSTRGLLEFFEDEVARFGDLSGQAIASERARLMADIDEAQSVVAQFGDRTVNVDDWIKVIPLKEIESASFYDPDAYKAWFATVQDSDAAAEATPKDEEPAETE